MALALFMGLLLVARRRTLEASLLRRSAPRNDAAGSVFVGWQRATARSLMLALLLFMPLAYFAPPAAGEPLPLGTFYYHGDHLGSSSIITNEQGVVVETAFYKPFGEFHERTGNPSGKHYFTGQERDDESSLYYYGARYYDPEMARFISADSIVASPYDPQDLNRYAYVRNNPIIYVDPSGHSLGDFFGVIFGIVVGIIVAAILIANPALGLAAWQIGAFAGAAGGFSAGVFSGGLKGGLIGALIGAVSGGIGGGIAGADPGFWLAVGAGAAGGGTAGALSAIFTGQNILQAAIMGAAIGAVTAAAMYGVRQAIRGAGKSGSGDPLAKGVETQAQAGDSLNTNVAGDTASPMDNLDKKILSGKSGEVIRKDFDLTMQDSTAVNTVSGQNRGWRGIIAQNRTTGEYEAFSFGPGAPASEGVALETYKDAWNALLRDNPGFLKTYKVISIYHTHPRGFSLQPSTADLTSYQSQLEPSGYRSYVVTTGGVYWMTGTGYLYFGPYRNVLPKTP